jgi:lysophospholipase L1-like esterase
MSSRFRILVAAVLAVAVLAGAAQAQAAPRYVALGDSFAAGPLIPLQIPPLGCLKSNNDYPHVVQRRLGFAEFRDMTCSGAETEDMTQPQNVWPRPNQPQFSALTPDTALVTLTIGGNDIGFAEIVNECAIRSPQRPHGAACRDYYHSGGRDELAERIEEAAPDVDAALAAIGELAPRARVLLVGYPAILPDTGPGCFPVVPFSPGDVAYLRETEKRLNGMLAARAEAAGVEFVDTYSPSIGHDVCQLPGVKWIEGLVPTAPAAPVHPNALGMAGMSAAVVETLTGEPVRTSGS